MKSGVSPQKLRKYRWQTPIWASICTPVAQSLLISSGHSPRLAGTSSHLGGHGPEMPLLGAGPVLYAKMPIETEETIELFSSFSSLVAFQFGGRAGPPGYAYANLRTSVGRFRSSLHNWSVIKTASCESGAWGGSRNYCWEGPLKIKFLLTFLHNFLFQLNSFRFKQPACVIPK